MISMWLNEFIFLDEKFWWYYTIIIRMLIKLFRYNHQISYLTSGIKKSTPSFVFPDTPTQMNLLYLGIYFLLTFSIAYGSLMLSLSFADLSNDEKIVAVPYVIMDISILYVFSQWFLKSSTVIGPLILIFCHFVNSK